MSKEPVNALIVSMATKGRENYHAGLKRLKDSIDAVWEHQSMLYTMDADVEGCQRVQSIPQPESFTCKPHNVVPYQFKFGIIQRWRELGIRKIFWLDSSLVLNKDITHLVDNEWGVMAFHNLGHSLHRYISDDALRILELTRSEAEDIKQTWGGAIGFDFDNPVACEIFDEIVDASICGAFNNGPLTGGTDLVAHRHDQAVMSVIFHRHGVELYDYGKIVTHPHYLPPYEYGTDFYISHVPMPS